MNRRSLLTAGAGAAAGAAAGVALPRPADATSAPPDPLAQAVAFEGRSQAGILTPAPAQALVVAFDAIAPSRAEVVEAIRMLSERARRLAVDHAVLLGAPGEGPTPDTGILGPRARADALTVTIGFGASLFRDRYGLSSRRPAGLTSMPAFPDDALVEAETGGDVLVQLCAGTQETLLNALRDLMRATRGALAVRWKIEAFRPATREDKAAPRNLLGFQDGTANPRGTALDRTVWTPTGATNAVVRIIRNRVEFWDRVGLNEQELMIGRDKATGAKLHTVPKDSHMALARAGGAGQRLLRRGFNYSRGVDEAGQLDMGLVFVAFCASIEEQFVPIQERLAGEGLTDYVKPTGGGYFHIPPGARGSDDWVGSRLLT